MGRGKEEMERIGNVRGGKEIEYERKGNWKDE